MSAPSSVMKTRNTHRTKECNANHNVKRQTHWGELQYLTRWQGVLEEDAYGEPAKSVTHRERSELVKYVREHGLQDVRVLIN